MTEKKIWIQIIMPRTVFLLFCFVFLWIAQTPSWGAESSLGESGSVKEGQTGKAWIFDQAGLFKDQALETIEAQAVSLSREMNMDVAVVTTQDADGMSAREYAENFYIEQNLGTGDSYDGIIFLIDMDNREIYIAPVGAMNRYLTDKRVNALLDAAYEEISEGDYEACANEFLKGVRKYYQAGIPSGQYNYDADTGKISVYRSIRWYEALLALIIAAITAWLPCQGVINSYAMKRERKQAGNYLMAYRADCQFQFASRNDDLVNKTVTHVILPRHNSNGPGNMGGGSSTGRSTTHTSSGRSFGGGGRKF